MDYGTIMEKGNEDWTRDKPQKENYYAITIDDK